MAATTTSAMMLMVVVLGLAGCVANERWVTLRSTLDVTVHEVRDRAAPQAARRPRQVNDKLKA